MNKTLLPLLASALLSGTATSAPAAQCTNDTWKKVMSAGKLVVGVKADYKPWGFRSENGEVVGRRLLAVE